MIKDIFAETKIYPLSNDYISKYDNYNEFIRTYFTKRDDLLITKKVLLTYF